MKRGSKEEVAGATFIAIVIIFFIGIILLGYSIISDTSTVTSPVEEMYHRQLVITLDSILDARFGSGCCEEVIDSDDVSVTHDEFGRVILPDK